MFKGTKKRTPGECYKLLERASQYFQEENFSHKSIFAKLLSEGFYSHDRQYSSFLSLVRNAKLKQKKGWVRHNSCSLCGKRILGFPCFFEKKEVCQVCFKKLKTSKK